MEALYEALAILNIDRYMTVAGATLWTYDYLLMFSTEVTTIWSRRWTLVEYLYLTNRYITPAYLIYVVVYLASPNPYFSKTLRSAFPAYGDDQSCQSLELVIFVLREIEMITSTWLVTLRVVILWYNVKVLHWIIWIAFIVMHIANATMGALTVQEPFHHIIYSPILRLCVSEAPKAAVLIYFIQIPYEFFLLALQLFHYWRIRRAISPVKPAPLLQTLYTDGVLWFLGMIVVRLWAGLTVIIAPPTYWWMTVATDVALTSIFISRMVLHLRVIASPTGTLVNGGATRSRSRYSGDPVFTAATISTATKPASSTAVMGHHPHHHQHHHQHQQYRRNEVEESGLARDSMWTVHTREDWDEEGARHQSDRGPDDESWEMDVVHRR
ncbi:hypothetical protein CPB86DRAFT_815597 [Serendipita vermifera]|nr:hypothetical protein CPB86DRAFT_815597 [Serendipita vermifera]